MTFSNASLSAALTALALSAWCSGCADNQPRPPAAAQEVQEHPEDGHAHGDEHDAHGEHGHSHEHSGETHTHHDEALTEKDIEMPTDVAGGVTRLEELHGQIARQIEEKELDHVHRTAEEMALVAKGVKRLAADEIADDKLTEVGRLCNEIAGCFPPIDEAADAGKAAETSEIHAKMGQAIERLKELTR